MTCVPNTTLTGIELRTRIIIDMQQYITRMPNNLFKPTTVIYMLNDRYSNMQTYILQWTNDIALYDIAAKFPRWLICTDRVVLPKYTADNEYDILTFTTVLTESEYEVWLSRAREAFSKLEIAYYNVVKAKQQKDIDSLLAAVKN